MLKLEDVSFISTLPNIKIIRMIDLANVKELPNVENNVHLESIYLENLKKLKDISRIGKDRDIKVIEIKH